MRIEFKPQNLINHLVDEKFIENGKVLKRIIETSGKKPRTIELTYKQTEFMPTEWYVANYNVVNRNNSNGQINKTLNTIKSKNETRTKIQRFYDNKNGTETNITIKNGNVTKKTKTI